MPNRSLWKYCAPRHTEAFLLSLGLFGDTPWPKAKRLACLYAVAKHAERHYRPATVLKRDGTLRHLYVPDPLLKGIQRNILRHVLAGFLISPHATAYRSGGSIVKNAAPHVGQKRVLKLDIADFFGSVTLPMVYRRAFPGAYFPPATRMLLSRLCCCYDRLPQGAPTSAAVSNLVLKPFDKHMAAWCQARGIRYTRYCDDMTFSGDFDAQPVIRKVQSFLGALGFVLNTEKTRVLDQGSRQMVTGIVVNEKPQASRSYRNALRQEIFYCGKYGPRSHLEHIQDTRYLPLGDRGIRGYLHALLGKIGFVLQVNPGDGAFLNARRAVLGMLEDCPPWAR